MWLDMRQEIGNHWVDRRLYKIVAIIYHLSETGLGHISFAVNESSGLIDFYHIFALEESPK